MTALTDVVNTNTAFASDVNQAIDRLNRISGDAGSVQIAGGTSGTATCYQILQETLKLTIIILNNFKTAGATQNLTLPVAYSTVAHLESDDTDLFSLQSGGVDQGVRLVTSLPAGAGGAGGTVAATTINGYSTVWLNTGFSVIQFKASWAAAHNGIIFIKGT